MIMGPRPTLGWIGFLLIGGSWYRLALLLMAFSLVTLIIVDEGQKTATLRHIAPAPFPPPTIFVHSPNNAHLTPLDACSVEAATVGLHQPHQPQERRRVYVYLWKTTVTSTDVWAEWLLHMRNVQMTYMDLPTLVVRTHLDPLKKASGLDVWRKWLAARLGLLWISGGVVMPFGSIMTKPLSVESGGTGSGLLLEDENQDVDPLVLATPSHHPILIFMAKHIINNTKTFDDIEMDAPGRLLTEAVKEECGLDKLRYLHYSDCSASFKLIPKDKVVDLDEKRDTFEQEPEGTALLRYKDYSDNYLHDEWFQRLFQVNKLKRFCPETARHLELRLIKSSNL